MRAFRFRRFRSLLLTISALAGCTGQAAPPPAPAAEAVDAEPAAPRATVALAYAPKSDEPAIAKALADLEAAPTSVEAHATLAMAFLRRARSTSNAVYNTYARDVLVAARGIDPDNTQIRTLSTMLLLEEHKFAAAAEAAVELAALAPHDPTPKLLLGDAKLELGDYEDAMDAYQAAIELRPDLRSYNRAAYLRWMQGDFDGALKVLELALQSGSARDPEPLAWCFTDLAAMYLHRGDSARAKAAAERALGLVDHYVPAQVITARALAREDKADDAAAVLTRAVEQRPSTEDFLRLVELHEARGDRDAAERALTEARALAARDPRPLAHFLARRSESRAEALELARKELESRHNLWSYDTLALALLRADRPQEAKEAIDKALALRTPDASFRLHAGLIDAALGDPKAAREHLQAALQLDPGVDPRLVDELRNTVGEA